MANFFRKFLAYFFPAIVLVGIIFYFFAWKNFEKANKQNPLPEQAEVQLPDNINNAGTNPTEETTVTEINNKEPQKTVIEPTSEKKVENQVAELPKSIKVSVPFTTQAPFANWDAVHEEACEEASLIMMKAYLNQEKLTQQKVEDDIQKLKDFQVKNYGDYKDSNMKQLLALAKDFYGIDNLKVIYDFDKEELKRQLARNKPIILPTAGRKLGNPNFKQPGPWYHNLVAIGFDGNTIITNDPGTRKGQDYTYSSDVLYSAIHDFPGKPEDIEKGRKAMIVIE